MSPISYLFLTATLMQMVWCGNAWYYQTTHSSQPASSQLVKHQFLLPPYPSYQHDILHQPHPSHHVVHDNRYFGTPGEFAEPSNYNELSFEGPYEITSPQVPGLYFRLSSGVFVPVKAVYSFPPFLERIIQRIQGYYSVYNPPDALEIETPIPSGGSPVPPQHNLLPVIPPNLPPPGGVPLEPLHPIGPLPPSPSPAGPVPAIPESPKPDEAPMTSETPEAQPSTTTESTKEETTPASESAASSSTESIESSTDSAVEETTTA